jgi:hypothetical protein
MELPKISPAVEPEEQIISYDFNTNEVIFQTCYRSDRQKSLHALASVRKKYTPHKASRRPFSGFLMEGERIPGVSNRKIGGSSCTLILFIMLLVIPGTAPTGLAFPGIMPQVRNFLKKIRVRTFFHSLISNSVDER